MTGYCIRQLYSAKLLLRDHNILAGVKLLQSPEIHGLLQQRNDVRIKGLPVRVLEVIFLALCFKLVIAQEACQGYVRSLAHIAQQ